MSTPRRLALLPLALASACAAAQPAEPPADPGPSDTEQVLESARSSVQSTAEWLARGVDSWFGDQPFEQGGGKVTDGRLDINLLKRQGDKLNLAVRFNARFKLPNFEKQTYLFIGRDAQSEVVSDTPGALSRQDRLLAAITEDNTFFAGVGRALTDSVDFRLGFRSGIKPYAQARYRHLWTLENQDLVEFRQTVFLTVQDGFGSTTAVSWERALSSTRALRWLTSATFTQDQPKVGWSSLAGAYQTYGHQRLLALEGIVQGREGSGVYATDLGLQARWEQPVHKDWLIGEVLMGHFWPRPDAQTPRRAAWALGLGVKMRL
jgi:hypothetical protein